jgi:hypothetical protein
MCATYDISTPALAMLPALQLRVLVAVRFTEHDTHHELQADCRLCWQWQDRQLLLAMAGRVLLLPRNVIEKGVGI